MRPGVQCPAQEGRDGKGEGEREERGEGDGEKVSYTGKGRESGKCYLSLNRPFLTRGHHSNKVLSGKVQTSCVTSRPFLPPSCLCVREGNRLGGEISLDCLHALPSLLHGKEQCGNTL